MEDDKGDLGEVFRAMEGVRVPGGCEHCDAYQTIEANYWGSRIHRICVHHDDWCPVLSKMQGTP